VLAAEERRGDPPSSGRILLHAYQSGEGSLDPGGAEGEVGDVSVGGRATDDGRNSSWV